MTNEELDAHKYRLAWTPEGLVQAEMVSAMVDRQIDTMIRVSGFPGINGREVEVLIAKKDFPVCEHPIAPYSDDELVPDQFMEWGDKLKSIL